MNRYKAGFIGCGHMGHAVATAVAAVCGATHIAICDRHPEKQEDLTAAGAVRADAAGTADADFLFIGVKPYAVADALREAGDGLAKTGALVSMATAVTISDIEAMLRGLGYDLPVIRMMPNTPVAVGHGVIQYAMSESTDERTEAAFRALLGRAGTVTAIREDKMDAASAVSGCGPAFAYMFLEALADGGVACGLSRSEAEAFAAGMVIGAGEMAKTYGHIGDLKNAVCSPGGSTIEGVRALEERAFRGAVTDAVMAAYEKTVRMKKK